MDVHADIESSSYVDIKTVGAWRYWSDESTRVLIVCWSFDNDTRVGRWFHGQPNPVELFEAIRKGARIFAHNAQFERLGFRWLAEHCGWPIVREDQWNCTAAQVAALSLPRSLDKAARAIGLEQNKSAEGTKLIRRFSMPQRSGKMILPTDDPLGFNEFIKYCAQDVRTERALHHAVPPLQAQEQAVWLMDTRINERGIPLDNELITAMQYVAKEVLHEITERTKALTGGLKPTQRDKLLAWIGSEGGDIDTLQSREIANALKRSMPDNVREVMELRGEAARVSVKKLAAAQASMIAGRVHGMFLYHGANTGRWAGRLLQPQNFPRGTFAPEDFDLAVELILRRDVGALKLVFGSVMSALANVMRGIIATGPGRKITLADFKQIEARVLAWLAGQHDVVQMFRDNVDLYRVMAAVIFHVDIDDVTGQQRFFGKTTVLGCGYQMGVDHFMDFCAAIGWPISRELAENCVYGYRNAWSKVPALWKKAEASAIAAVSTGRPTYIANCKYYTEDNFLFCELPSGRRIAYYAPRLVMDTYYNKPTLRYMAERYGQWYECSTYGGKLVENFDQAISRDFMVDGMHRIESAGMQIVGTIHDEVIVEHDDNQYDANELAETMRKIPSWGHGCPVDAEGFTTPRYRKELPKAA